MKKDNIKIKGYRGTWYAIDESYYRGNKVYLLEHEQLGDETACMIIDKNYNILSDEVYNGFSDLYN